MDSDYLRLKSGSDVRGIAVEQSGEPVQLDETVARRVGAAFADWLCNRMEKKALTVAVGRDSRTTGPALAEAVCRGLASRKVRVLDCGLCTTPAMFMTTVHPDTQCDGAVMVTASHLPWYRNGLKFFTAEGGLEGTEITSLLRAASALDVPELPTQTITVDFLALYQEMLMEKVRTALLPEVAKPLLGLHVVVDAGNGAGGFFEQMLLELGAWTEGSQFLEPDGRFPNHIPNPEAAEAMDSIAQAVVRVGADLGVIFDADCDRAALVDASGRPIHRNRLIAMVSAILLTETPGASIVTDSVTSSGLKRFINEWGGEHYRFKRGYRNVIDEAIRLNACGIDCPLAMETSGHAALREHYFMDDGMYLVTRLIIEAMRRKREDQTLSTLLDGLQEPVESVEIRLQITAEDFQTAGHDAIDQVLAHTTDEPAWHVAKDNREGVRICFDLQDGMDNGWFLLRLSLHDPVLPLNAESDVPGGVRKMLCQLYDVLRDCKGLDLAPLQKALKEDLPQ